MPDDIVCTLAGVGVGPGDPSLMTLQAMRILEAADVILVPATERRADIPGRAEEIVLANLPAKRSALQRVPFSMTERRGVGTQRNQAWDASAAAAIEAFDVGARLVAFATVGDPSVYSTFSYLVAKVTAQREVEIIVAPGITAMQALAARSRTPLVEGQEVLALVPATVGDEALRKVCAVADTVTIYKGGRTLPALAELLDDEGRLDGAVVGTDVGLESERIGPLACCEEAPYFSAVLSAPHRTTAGGRI